MDAQQQAKQDLAPLDVPYFEHEVPSELVRNDSLASSASCQSYIYDGSEEGSPRYDDGAEQEEDDFLMRRSLIQQRNEYNAASSSSSLATAEKEIASL